MMTWGFVYALILLLWLIFGLYWGFRPNGDRWFGGGSVVLFVLFAILGYAVFGPLVR